MFYFIKLLFIMPLNLIKSIFCYILGSFNIKTSKNIKTTVMKAVIPKWNGHNCGHIALHRLNIDHKYIPKLVYNNSGDRINHFRMQNLLLKADVLFTQFISSTSIIDDGGVMCNIEEIKNFMLINNISNALILSFENWINLKFEDGELFKTNDENKRLIYKNQESLKYIRIYSIFFIGKDNYKNFIVNDFDIFKQKYF